MGFQDKKTKQQIIYLESNYHLPSIIEKQWKTDDVIKPSAFQSSLSSQG